MSDPVNNARALLRLFGESGARDLHVRLGDFALFIATPDGGPNPMRAVAPPLALVQGVAADQDVAGADGGEIVRAPHVATFVSALAVGSTVTAGDGVATIDLLGEQVMLAASGAGIVAEVLAAEGALLDFGAPVVRIAAA